MGIKNLYIWISVDDLNIISVLVFITLLPIFVSAQDIHFSQFMSSPLNLNPAHAGNFDGAYRVVGNARQQWNSVTIPYQTIGGSVDARNILNLKNVGAGLSVYDDKTGDSRFTTLQANAALSYTIKLNHDSTQFLALGLQSGITQRSINYENLKYDNQYNGLGYDPNLNSNETYTNASKVYPNLNAGINWMKKTSARHMVSTGVSLNNINRPAQSFFGQTKVRLDPRLNFHILTQFPVSKKVDLLPSFLWMNQGTFNEVVLGSSIKYILNPKADHYRALYFGAWTRAADAGWLTVGMDYGNLYVGLSYDINYSKLTPASNTRGGLELSVIYIIRNLLPKRKNYKICPNYI